MNFLKNILSTLFILVILAAKRLSIMTERGYFGYKKNEIKYGRRVLKQFQRAVLSENAEWLNEFLTRYRGVDVNYYSDEKTKYRGYNFETLKVICYTFSNSKYRNDIFKILIEKGLNLNLKFSNGHYGLDLLCVDDTTNPYLVKTMLENGADPNNANSAGFYNIDLGDSKKTTLHLPIYWAIYKPMYTNAEDLLNHGAVVNYEILDNVHGHNIEGSAKPYQLAFKSYMEKTGESPFTKAEEYAILGESDKLIEELKNGEELDEEAALVVKKFICSFCNVEALKVWNDIYYDKVKTKFTTYLLMIAAYEGNYEIIKYMFDEGIEDFTINEALKRAAQAGSYDVCKFLIENGSLKEEKSYTEFLNVSFQGKDADTFRLIANYLSERELINEKDIYSFFWNQTVEWDPFTKDVIDCLIDDCGFTMSFFKCDHVDYDTMKYLFDKGKQLSVFDLPMAIASKDTQLVEYIFDKGADPNQGVREFGIDSEENKKLFLPYKEALATLKRDDSGCIKYAVRYGTSEIVQMLIDHGADLSDEEILACAITDSSKATFDALFNAGASLDYKNDKSKETLMDLAKSMGRYDIVKILRKEKVKSYSGF